MLKSVFITFLPITSLFVVIISLTHMADNVVSIGDFGLLISASVIVLFFIFLFLFRRPRTSQYVSIYSFGVLVGLLLSTIAFIKGDMCVTLWMASLSLSLMWGLYLFWYSAFSNSVSDRKLAVGKDLPTFVLRNGNGEMIKSTSYLGRFAVFIFYRGNWCPLCIAQVKEIATEYSELKKLNAQVILVSPQPSQQTQKLASRFQVDFDFLVDERNLVAQQLDIDIQNGIPFGFQVLGYASDTVRPTVLVVDPDGQIIYSDIAENYRLRPEPQEFIRVIREYRT